MSGERETLAARLRETAAKTEEPDERDQLLAAAEEAEGRSLVGSGEPRYDADRLER